MTVNKFFTYSIVGIWAAVVFGAYWLFHYEPIFVMLALVLTVIFGLALFVFQKGTKKHGTYSPKIWHILVGSAGIAWLYIMVFGLSMSDIGLSQVGVLHSLGYTTVYWLFLFSFFVITTSFGAALQKVFVPKSTLHILFKNGFGIIALIVVATVMGWLGFFTPVAAVVVGISILAFSYTEIKDLLVLIFTKRITLSYDTRTCAHTLQSLLPFAALLLLAIFILLGFRAVPLVADDLAVYYRVPLLFAEMGGIVPFYDGFTAAHYGAFSYVSALLHTFLPRYVLMVLSPYFFILTIWAVYTAGATYKDHSTGVLAATLAAITPWHIYFAFTSKVILLFSFTSVLGVCALLLYTKKKQSMYLHIAGLFLGAAVGIKLNGMFLAVGFIGCLIILLLRKDIGLKQLLIASAMMLAAFLPQGLTNIALYNDPLINTPGLHKKSDTLFDNNKTYLLDVVRHSTVRSERAQEYLTIRQQNDVYEDPVRSALWSLWNNTVHQRGYNLLYIDIGFLSLVLLPLVLVLFYKSKKNTNADVILVSLFVISGLAWLVFGKGSVWYGIALWYVWWIGAARFLTDINGLARLILYLGVLLQALTVGILALSSIQPANITWLTRNTPAWQVEKSGLWYDTAQQVNARVDLEKNERVLFIPEQKAVYVTRNHEVVIADSLGHYWAHIVHESKGDFVRIHEVLQRQNIRYIVHANNSEEWLRSLVPGDEQDEYLLYTNLDTLQMYLNAHAQKVDCNNIACVYAIK